MLTPILERIAVAQVPIFCPMMMGIAIPYVMPPVIERACSMPTEAAELWMIAVMTRPVRTPRMGFLNDTRILAKAGESASGSTDPLMRSIPYMRMANPTRPLPRSFLFSRFDTMIRIIPINASNGEKESGFSILIKILSLEIPIRLMIQAVIVVPIFEPMITPTVLLRSMMPELTRPTSMTVTAEEL